MHLSELHHVSGSLLIARSAGRRSSLVQSALTSQGAELLPLEEARKEFERDYLTQLLKITNGNVAQAAKLARRNRTDFYGLLARHQIESASFKV